jgi:TonB family protein
MAALMLSLSIFCQTGQAQQAQLSLADVLIGLRSKKVSLDDRNRLLSEAVKVRGITFSLTPELETELAGTGASTELVEAIRQKSLKVKVAAVTKPAPIPAATPAPVATPTPAPDFAFYRKRADENNFKGEFDLALNDYSKAIELNPKDAVSYLNRGRAHSNKKSYDLAVLDLDKTIELNPKDSMAYFLRADVHEKKGNAQQAIGDYQKAIDADAANEPAKTNLKRLLDEQAKNLAKQKEEEQARIAAKQKETPKVVVPEQPKAGEQTDAPKTMELGSLINRAVKMITPSYPLSAKQLRIDGQVKVQVTLDEKGNVTSAKAVEGPQFLRSASEDAARNSKFKPAVAGTEAVKGTGFILYNFTNKM